MKSLSILSTFIVLNLILGSFASAQTGKKTAGKKQINFAQDVDTLGGNEALVEKATALDPSNKTRIVQSRLVDRNYRFEIGGNYGGVAGGDAYLRTQNFGLAADFHISPRWSIGARYYDYGNDLTAEGRRTFDKARKAYSEGGQSYVIPDIDYPLQSTMGVITWYPVYGKTNLLDIGIAQFDMYLLAGGGQIKLSSGWTGVTTAGAGVGFWLTQHLSARTEIRYQNYKDQIITGPRNVNTAVATIGIGLLL